MESLLGTKDSQNEMIIDEVSLPFIANDHHVHRTKAVAAS